MIPTFIMYWELHYRGSFCHAYIGQYGIHALFTPGSVSESLWMIPPPPGCWEV